MGNQKILNGLYTGGFFLLLCLAVCCFQTGCGDSGSTSVKNTGIVLESGVYQGSGITCEVLKSQVWPNTINNIVIRNSDVLDCGNPERQFQIEDTVPVEKNTFSLDVSDLEIKGQVIDSRNMELTFSFLYIVEDCFPTDETDISFSLSLVEDDGDITDTAGGEDDGAEDENNSNGGDTGGGTENIADCLDRIVGEWRIIHTNVEGCSPISNFEGGIVFTRDTEGILVYSLNAFNMLKDTDIVAVNGDACSLYFTVNQFLQADGAVIMVDSTFVCEYALILDPDSGILTGTGAYSTYDTSGTFVCGGTFGIEATR